MKVEPPAQRIRWIFYRGTEILQVDFSQCTAEQVQRVAQEVADYVTRTCALANPLGNYKSP
jgi:hypothetical protein